MSLRHGLSRLGRGLVSGATEALPQRGGAGAPIKLAPRPDKPLPAWYEMWWDNGVFPGQPAADYLFGPLPANLTETWYLKVWALFGTAMALPIIYYANFTSEFDHPLVPQQYPPEVREVLLRANNTAVSYDYSQPDYEHNKARRKGFWTGF